MAETLRVKYGASFSAFILGSIIYLYAFEFPTGGNATISVSLVFLFLSFLFIRFSKQQFYYFLYFMITMIAVFISQRLFQPLPFDISRTMLGLFLLIFGSLATIALWDRSQEEEHTSLLNCIRIFTYLHFFVQIGQAIFGDILGISKQASYFSFIARASGLALEASHVGMMLAPLVFISIVYPEFFTKNFGRSLHFVLAISILVIGISSTGVIIYGMALICRFIVRRSLAPLFWGGPIIVATIFLPNQSRNVS